jgi:hypothetical protein
LLRRLLLSTLRVISLTGRHAAHIDEQSVAWVGRQSHICWLIQKWLRTLSRSERPKPILVGDSSVAWIGRHGVLLEWGGMLRREGSRLL